MKPEDIDNEITHLLAVMRRGNHSCGATAIALERQRQIAEEGWNAVHDARLRSRELSAMATCYLWNELRPFDGGIKWPLWECDFKPTDLRRNLVKAGALIAAEIDRLDRETARINAACGDKS